MSGGVWHLEFSGAKLMCTYEYTICEHLNMFTTKSNNLQPDSRLKVEGQQSGEFHGLLVHSSAFIPENTHTFSTNLREIKPSALGFPPQILELLFCFPFSLWLLLSLLCLESKTGTLGCPCYPGQKPDTVLLELFLDDSSSIANTGVLNPPLLSFAKQSRRETSCRSKRKNL